MASLLTLPALALSNPSSRGALPHAFRCWALRRRGWGVAAAVASPNSVLTEHAFKRLRLGGDDEEYGREAGAGLFEGRADEIAVARLGLPDELVATLEKRGITHLFPIQV
jgi:ATP-dependent RNA helicase DDX21